LGRAISRRWPWLAAAVAIGVLPYLPGLSTNFGRSLLSQMGIAALFALSYNVLLGQTGLLSFGHAVYFGLGGYVAMHLLRAVDGGLRVPVPLVPLAGALGGLFFGVLFGSVTTRRAHTVFALISLGIGELVYAATLMLPSFFGGEEGITANRSRGPRLFGLSFAPQIEVYFVIAAWVLLSAALLHRFTRTPVGRMCNAVRDNPERAEFVGYNTQRIRFIAFCVGATFAGLAGGLHALNYEIVASEAVSPARSGNVILMAFCGGTGNFIGPVLGAVVITWLQVSLSDYTSAWLLYLGLFFMALVLYAPGGLVGLAMMQLAAFRRVGVGRLVRAYALALVPVLAIFVGSVALIEMAYRRSTQPEAGPRMKLFWVALDTSTPWPWIGALALAIVGYLAWRWLAPRVAAAWEVARA